MDAETEGRIAAEKFRQEYRLGIQPLGDLVAIIEQATGIDVAILEVGPEEHGLTMRDPVRNAVFIGVARTRNPMRQRSTLAHELGHVLFQDWASSGKNEKRRSSFETRADAFARHLLLPLEGLCDFLGHREVTSRSDLSDVVQRFLVSPQIAAIASHQADYIDANTKQQWLSLNTPQLATRFGWSDQYQALQIESDQRRAPQGLLARAIKGYEEGVLSAQAIATLRGVTLEETEAELLQAGVIPTEQPIVWADPSTLPDVDVDLAALDALLNASDSDAASPTQKRDVT